jgi:hypothetical protein
LRNVTIVNGPVSPEFQPVEGYDGVEHQPGMSF